jgi:hypothetical protein
MLVRPGVRRVHALLPQQSATLFAAQPSPALFALRGRRDALPSLMVALQDAQQDVMLRPPFTAERMSCVRPALIHPFVPLNPLEDSARPHLIYPFAPFNPLEEVLGSVLFPPSAGRAEASEGGVVEGYQMDSTVRKRRKKVRKSFVRRVLTLTIGHR